MMWKTVGRMESGCVWNRECGTVYFDLVHPMETLNMISRIGKSPAMWAAVAMLFFTSGLAQAQTKPKYRGMLKDQKSNPWKIRREGDKTFIWAGGDKSAGKGAKWYDFTGAPMSPDELQFGIGKDSIRAIDDPYFVSPDDPRLLKVPPSPYRPTEKPKTNNEINGHWLR